MQHLRVCWQGKYKDINCCECEKCIRNILTFRITQKSLPNCFQKDVSDKMLERISLQVGGPLDSFKSLYYSAAQSNIKDAWVEILRKKIRAKERSILVKRLFKKRDKRARNV